MQNGKYYIKTFGCQMNVADSGVVAELLLERGCVPAESPAAADIIIVNTCTVRGMAEHKARSFLGKLEPLAKEKPALKIVVAGCLAEQLGDRLINKFPFVRLVMGAKSVEQYDELLTEFIASDASQDGKASLAFEPVSYVNIMRGCDNFCSYCIVPHVRGREKSRPPHEILAEIEKIAANGTKEVTLLGQNVNSYKGSYGCGVSSSKQASEAVDFASLIHMANDIKGIERLRFMTSHPKDLSHSLVDAVAGLDKVCKHIHLPLQSGSDRILGIMNRKYTVAEYLKKIRIIRENIQDVCISSDVMVGFPGETSEEFDQTLQSVREADFDFVFAFKYSPRPGTQSWKLADDVSKSEKASRLDRLLDLTSSISLKKNAKLKDTVAGVLVEGCERGGVWGHTESKKKVFFEGDKSLIGRIVQVRLTEPKINTFKGELI